MTKNPMMNKMAKTILVAISEWKIQVSQIPSWIILWGRKIVLSLIIIAVNMNLFAEEQDDHFDFKRYLTDPPQTLSLQIGNIDYSTGKVSINGGDSRCPSISFTWDWGDGTTNDGWFPRGHNYSDLTKNYIVKVTAHYSASETDSAEILVRFTPPPITAISIAEDVAVSIPDSDFVLLPSRMPGYGIPSGLTYFGEGFFNVISRSTVEYILSVAAFIQKDFINDNLYLVDGGFRQVLLRDPSFGCMYSLWYTNPVSFGVGDYGFQGTIQWSSFIHEMGHNFTLNSPSHYYFGGKIDGNANAIYSETMAQIFQHATAYEMINNATTYGLSADIVADIKLSAISSIKIVRDLYESYLNSGMNFASWNDPATPDDNTLNTFMTLAYKFFENAENSGLGYRIPLKRMMELLQVFNENLRQKYNQDKNTVAADTFRATVMATAISYAFSTDLRTDFRNLNFPVSDNVYADLLSMITEVRELDERVLPRFKLKQNYPNPFNPVTSIDFSIPFGKRGLLSIFNINGQLIESHRFDEGCHRFFWDGSTYASGIYFYKLSLDKHYEIKKMLMIW